MRQNGIKTADDATDNREEIAPMLKTKWNQDAPYNDLCPMIGDNRSVTGGEATAMAQVMKYHNWPEKDAGGVTFDWNNMLDTYTSEATDEQKNAVATLMQAVGAAIDTKYGVEYCTADDYRIAPALIEKFGYDKSATLLLRKYYSRSQWENIIYEQLVKYGPVILKGYSGSHYVQTFVCDGYQKGGYFHINWGWGGLSDGFFRLSAVNPEVTGIGDSSLYVDGFNDNQSAVINICKPQTESTYRVNVLSDDRFMLAESHNTGEYTIAVSMNFYTMSSIEITGTPTIMFVSDNISIAAKGEGQVTLQPTVKMESYKVALPENIPDGTYEVMPVFEYDKQYLPIQTPFGAIKTATAKISDGKLSLENFDYEGVVFTNGYIWDRYNSKSLDVWGNLVNRTMDGRSVNISAEIYDADMEKIVATGKPMKFYLDSKENKKVQYGTELITSDGEPLAEDTYYAVIVDADTHTKLSIPVPFIVLWQTGIEGVATEGESVVKIYDLNGLETDAATLAPGIYIVETRDAAGNISRRLVRK